MVETLVIDPGLRVAGVSFWRDGNLIDVGLVRTRGSLRGGAAWLLMAEGVRDWVDPLLSGAGPINIVLEQMIYIEDWAKSKKGNVVEDLFQLSGVSGAIVGLIPSNIIREYAPTVWKPRREPKPTTHRKLRLRLRPKELEIMDRYIKRGPAKLVHNGLDAAAIGAYHFRRKIKQ